MNNSPIDGFVPASPNARADNPPLGHVAICGSCGICGALLGDQPKFLFRPGQTLAIPANFLRACKQHPQGEIVLRLVPHALLAANTQHPGSRDQCPTCGTDRKEVSELREFRTRVQALGPSAHALPATPGGLAKFHENVGKRGTQGGQ